MIPEKRRFISQSSEGSEARREPRHEEEAGLPAAEESGSLSEEREERRPLLGPVWQISFIFRREDEEEPTGRELAEGRPVENVMDGGMEGWRR